MNNTFSLEQRSKSGNLDSNMLLRQYKFRFDGSVYGNQSSKPENKKESNSY